MQRFINDPNQVVDDMLQGYVKAHKTLKLSDENHRVISLKEKVPGKALLVVAVADTNQLFLAMLERTCWML